MNKVTFKEYYDAQAEFLSKHDCRIYYEGDCNYYSKHWASEDGAEMYEVNRIINVPRKLIEKGVEVIVRILLWESECWSTEFGSMYLYQNASKEDK